MRSRTCQLYNCWYIHGSLIAMPGAVLKLIKLHDAVTVKNIRWQLSEFGRVTTRGKKLVWCSPSKLSLCGQCFSDTEVKVLVGIQIWKLWGLTSRSSYLRYWELNREVGISRSKGEGLYMFTMGDYSHLNFKAPWLKRSEWYNWGVKSLRFAWINVMGLLERTTFAKLAPMRHIV